MDESGFFGGRPTLLAALRRFFKLYVHTLRVEYAGEGVFRLNFRRICILCWLGILFPLVIIWNHVGFWLDDLLYPRWRQEPVVSPVFIVGNARSGTTWIHRILCSDSDHFTAPETWEIVFAASVTWRRLFGVCMYVCMYVCNNHPFV